MHNKKAFAARLLAVYREPNTSKLTTETSMLLVKLDVQDVWNGAKCCREAMEHAGLVEVSPCLKHCTL